MRSTTTVPTWPSKMWIVDPTNSATLELHFVLRESARLVREDILNLTQVFRDVQGPALHRLVRLLVVQLNVLHDEVHLAKLHQLHGHVQRQRYHRLEVKEITVLYVSKSYTDLCYCE